MTTHHNDTTALPSPQTPKAQTEAKPSQSSPQRAQRKFSMFHVLLTILILLSISVSIFSLYTQKLLRQQQFTVNQETKNQLQTLSHHTNDAFDTLHQEVSTLQTTLQEQTAQTKRWLLFKARYYLELAAINTRWSDDLATSTALLQQADLLLTKVPSQPTLDIRQAIAQEINQNAQYAALDIPGLLSQLDAIQRTLTTLPFKKFVALADGSNHAVPSNTAPNTWRTHLQASLQQLEKLVIIRHHDQAIQPLLTPAYEAMLRENIRLNLQTAQWSLLQRQHTVYQIALQQAIENISQGFDTTTNNTKTLMAQLDTLMHTTWIEKKPSINTSLTRLNQYIESSAKTPSKPSTEGEPS